MNINMLPQSTSQGSGLPAYSHMGAAAPAHAMNRGSTQVKQMLRAPVLTDQNGSNFPLAGARYAVDVRISSMFVTFEGSWRASRAASSCMFKLPTSHKATVTKIADAASRTPITTARIMPLRCSTAPGW